MKAYQTGDDDKLRRMLGLRPWELSPLDDDCPYPKGSAAALSWPQAQRLRAALIERIKHHN